MGVGKTSLILLAVAALLSLLVSCGDTVYEAKGGQGGSAGTPTGTINISVKDGAGQTSFTKKSDSVTVTLLNDPRNQGFPTSVLVDNGGVTFTGLTAGEYQVRVSKPGYASSFSGKLELQNKQDYNDKNQDYFILRTISETVDLFPLTAGLKGTIRYSKPDGKEVGAAAGATVQIVIEDERLADNREQQVTTGPDGSFTFAELPATNNADYNIKALSKTFGDVVFADAVVTGGLALRPNVTQTLTTQTAYTTPVAALLITTSTVSVSKEEEIEVVFSEELDAANLAGANVQSVRIGSDDVPIEVPVWNGNKVTIKPKLAWRDVAGASGANIIVTFTGVRSKDGKILPTGTTVTVGVLDAAFGAFKILKNRGSVNDVGNVILTDSTSHIVLVFSKNIDESRISGTGFSVLSVDHKTKISNDTLILSPLGNAWGNVSTLTFSGSSGDKTKGLYLIKSVDGQAWDETSNPSISVITKIVDPFGLVGVDEISLGVLDTLGSVVLKFNSEIDVEKTSGSDFAAVTGLTLGSDGKPSKTAVLGATGRGVRKFFEGDEIVITPTALNWTSVGATGEKYNAIKISEVFGVNGTSAKNVVFYVYRAAPKTFRYLGPTALSTGTDSGAVSLVFDDILGADINSFVQISTKEPVTFSRESGDSVLTVKPIPGFIWSKATGTPKTFKITLDPNLPSKSGGVIGLVSEATDEDPEVKFEITVTVGGSASGSTFNGTQKVVWYGVDESLTSNGAIPTVDGKVALAWHPVSNATKYRVSYFAAPGKGATEVVTTSVNFTVNPSSGSNGVFYTEGGVYAGASKSTDTISINVLDPIVSAGVYRFVVVPEAADGSVGDTSSVLVTTRPTVVDPESGDDFEVEDAGVFSVVKSGLGVNLVTIIKALGDNGNVYNFNFTTTEELDVASLSPSASLTSTGLSSGLKTIVKSIVNVSIRRNSGDAPSYRVSIFADAPSTAAGSAANKALLAASSSLDDVILTIEITGNGTSGGKIFHSNESDVLSRDVAESWKFNIELSD